MNVKIQYNNALNPTKTTPYFVNIHRIQRMLGNTVCHHCCGSYVLGDKPKADYYPLGVHVAVNTNNKPPEDLPNTMEHVAVPCGEEFLHLVMKIK